MQPQLRTALTLAVLAAASGTARADSYRAQITVVDLVGGGAFAGGVELGTSTTSGLALAIGGLTVAALGAPILHGAEGNYGRMTASIILRAGLPPIGMLVGDLLSPQNHVKFRHGGGLLGFMAGYAVATIVDIAMASTSNDPSTSARVFSFGGHF